MKWNPFSNNLSPDVLLSLPFSQQIYLVLLDFQPQKKWCLMNCPSNLLAAPVGVAQLIKVDALAQSRARYYGEYVTYSLSKRANCRYLFYYYYH